MSIFTLLALGAVTLGLTGCDGGSSSDINANSTGPADAQAFAGTTISLNPVIVFSAGNNLTYTNEDTPFGSPFPIAETPTNGTYSYVPSADYSQGTLSLTINDELVLLDLSNFIHEGRNIVRFTARYRGQSYPVEVTGNLPAYVPGSGENPDEPGQTRADDIPSNMRGAYYNMAFFPNTEGSSSSPGDVPDSGSTSTFVIKARSLTVDGRLLTGPVFYEGDESEWLFKDGSITYGVSESIGGGVNSIVVYGPLGATGPGTALGEYRAVQTVELTNGLLASGYYPATVTSSVVQAGYPDDQRYTVGDVTYFEFSPDGALVDGVSYTYSSTGSTSENGSRTLVYESIFDTFTDRLTVKISTVGSTDYLESFEIVRTRNAASPATGTAIGTFVFTP